MSNRQRKDKISTITKLLKHRTKKKKNNTQEQSTENDVDRDGNENKNTNEWKCPKCQELMSKVSVFIPSRASPII